MQQLQTIGQLGRSTFQSTANKSRSSATGRLQITVLEAINLQKKDESFYNNIVSNVVVQVTQDNPYCKIQIGKKVLRTSSKNNTLNPKWNETFLFENVEIGDEIKILIRDDITIGKAHVYGEVFVPLITFKKNEDVEDWYPLRGTKKKSLIDVVEDNGSLLLRINFQPDPPKFKEEKQKFIEGILNPTILEEPPQEKSQSKISIRTSRSNSASSGSGDDESEKNLNASTVNTTNLFGISPPKFRKSSLDEESEKRRQNFVAKFNLPSSEILLGAFTAALSKQILLHGRLYISHNYFCFYSNVFAIKTFEVIKVSEIIEIKKNSLGIQITTHNNKYNFGSFFFRDRAYNLLVNTWRRIGSDEEEKTEKEISPTPPEEEDDLDDVYLSNPEDENSSFLSASELTELIREEFPLSPIKFFKLFFSDASFTEKFRQQRGDTEIIIKDWTQNSEQGNLRELQYRVLVNQPMGPPSARMEETQRYYLTKSKLTVESISVMYDIPYGDYFRIETRWDLEANAENTSSLLTICTAVHFLKKTIFKSKIQSTTINETKASFNDWVKLARSEIQRQKSLSTPKCNVSDRENETKGEKPLSSSSSIPSLALSSNSTNVVLVKGETIVKSEKRSVGIIAGGVFGIFCGFYILFKLFSLEAIIGASTLAVLIYYIILTEERDKNLNLQIKSMESRILSLENIMLQKNNQKKTI